DQSDRAESKRHDPIERHNTRGLDGDHTSRFRRPGGSRQAQRAAQERHPTAAWAPSPCRGYYSDFLAFCQRADMVRGMGLVSWIDHRAERRASTKRLREVSAAAKPAEGTGGASRPVS